jgi:hypothetical protein
MNPNCLNATIILCRFSLSEKPKENNNSIRDLLKSLFFLYLSGTHASAEQRLKVVEQLIQSDAEQEQELGLLLLDCALETWHFSSLHGFDFGARSRDYGYSPKTQKEVQQWFTVFINFSTTKLAISEQPIANKVKILLAEKFRGLWINAGMYDELEIVANTIIQKSAWNEGWIAVRTTLGFDSKNMPAELLHRLQILETLLKPNSLQEKIRAYVLSNSHSLSLTDAYNADDESEGNEYKQLEQIQRGLGREVAANEAVFNELLPELVTVDVTGAGLVLFAEGLAERCTEHLAMWEKIRNQLSAINQNQRNCNLLCGFLNAISLTYPEITEQILNEAVVDEILAVCFPQVQTTVKINEQGVERLKLSLNNNLAPVWTYRYLAYGRAHESINDENLCDLLRLLISKPDGLAVAVDILQMRLRGIEDCSSIIASFGQELLVQVDFDRHSYRMDYALGIIVKACLVGEIAATVTTIICKKIAESPLISFMDYQHILKNIAKQQPQIFLDEFCDAESSMFIYNHEHSKFLSHIQDNIIIDWCEINPSARYPKIAACIVAYQPNEQKNGLEWTPLSLAVINKAPDIAAVLNAFKNNFSPTSWSGSRAGIMEQRLSLITQLKTHENPIISVCAHDAEKAFAEEIERERQWENERNRTQDERFE